MATRTGASLSRGERSGVVADELDRPKRRAELRQGLLALRREAEAFPTVGAALEALLEDPDLAWRAFSCSLLAEELDEE